MSWYIIIDNYGAYNNWNSKYVIPISGFYEIRFWLYIFPNSALYLTIYMYINGNWYNIHTNQIYTAGWPISCELNRFIKINAGDDVQFLYKIWTWTCSDGHAWIWIKYTNDKY